MTKLSPEFGKGGLSSAPKEVGARPADQALVQAPSPTVSALTGFDPSRDKTTLLVSDADKPLAWLDVDDETLGKFCRKFLIMATRENIEQAEARDMPMISLLATHGGIALCRMAHEANADRFTTELTAARSTCGEMGDWKISVKRLKRPAIAIEARSDATGTGAAEGESADPQGIAQGEAA